MRLCDSDYNLSAVESEQAESLETAIGEKRMAAGRSCSIICCFANWRYALVARSAPDACRETTAISEIANRVRRALLFPATIEDGLIRGMVSGRRPA